MRSVALLPSLLAPLAFLSLPFLLSACGEDGSGPGSDFGGVILPSDPAAEEEALDDLVASFNRQGITDLTKTTHIILVGDSEHLAALPLYSATTRARRYVDLYPNDQIILFVTRDVSANTVAGTGATVLRREGLGPTMIADLSRLTATGLVAALDRFTRIASIDFYGHSSPFGVLLEKSGDNRTLGGELPSNIDALEDNFALDRDPYVTLNGCNGGVHTAAALSNIWNIPVSGALSGTIFEVLMSDGLWYGDDPTRHPSWVGRVSRNNRSFASSSTPSCANGACVRMKPENAPYGGIWAAPEGFQYGLNYFKFFCDFADPTSRCSRGMATSLLAFPSVKPIDVTSPDADIQDVLADFFCNTSADATWFGQCKSELLAAVAGGTPFSPMKGARDYALECDFQGCTQQFRCDEVGGVPQKHSCAWVSATCGAAQSNAACRPKNTIKQTTRLEVERYLAGFQALRGIN